MGAVQKERPGFTLIEMLIVLLIIAAVLMIVLPGMRATGVQAHGTACEANLRLIRTQLENYYLAHQYQYPPEGRELEELVGEGYLMELPICPAGGEYSIVVDEHDEAHVYCNVHHPQHEKEETGRIYPAGGQPVFGFVDRSFGLVHSLMARFAQ